MEGVTKKTEVNNDLCVFCKLKKPSEVCNSATDIGFATFQESAKKRILTIDTKYGAFLDHYLNLSRENLQYHRKCYSDFTNKSKISRLHEHNPSVNSESQQTNYSANASTASFVQVTDWSLCVICQKVKQKDHLRKVSADVATKFEELAKWDDLLFARIRDTNLEAAHVSYHGLCLIDLERRCKKKSTAAQKKPSAFNDLCAELRASADGKVSLNLMLNGA